ncbi:hypothetical protein HGO21_03320 [Acinetobacter sp. CUI P1]|nr:hypothetical protein [Acinetobacter sp. CUI P1]
MLIPRVLLPRIVRENVTLGVSGVYMLGDNEHGFIAKYIGRSDNCLQTRLVTHNYLYKYDYFVFEYANSTDEAYRLECQLWHSISRCTLSNMIHPAAPRNRYQECPYCHFARHVIKYFA